MLQDRLLNLVGCPMPDPVPASLAGVRKELTAAGFEVFRVRGDLIILAERPRENLIMDSCVALRLSDPLEIRVTFRVRKVDYPHWGEDQLFERARQLAAATASEGFEEVDTAITVVPDPGHGERTIDTLFDVVCATRTPSVSAALEMIRRAMTFERHG